jgi:protein-tyrosine-phosphatase, low molecular weight
MTKILFICHGNICRSPMAEFVMKDLAAKAGKRGAFEIASAAVSREELATRCIRPQSASFWNTAFAATAMRRAR